MSQRRESEDPDWKQQFHSVQQLSQRLATVVENSDASPPMKRENEVPSWPTRPSTTVSFPPRSSSMPTAVQQTPLIAPQLTTPAESTRYPAVEEGESLFGPFKPSTTVSFPHSSSMPTSTQQTPFFASQLTTPVESTTRYPAVGEGESLFGPFRPSTSTSAPPRPSSIPTTLGPTGSTVQNTTPGRTVSQNRSTGVWLMPKPPRLLRYPAIPATPPAVPGATLQYPTSGIPASTTTPLPPRLSSNSTPIRRNIIDSQLETQSNTTGADDYCCLLCAKQSHDYQCGTYRSIDNRCLKCVYFKVACTPIPAKYLAEFRSIQQLNRARRYIDAAVARRAWVESMEASRQPDTLPTRQTWAESSEGGTSLARIERQLFLLNRNVERMLNVNLRMIGQASARPIEEEFPEE